MSEDTTSTASTRHKYTNDAIAVLLVVATVGAVGGSLYVTGGVPRPLAVVFAVESLLAATWAFGRDTLGAVADAWSTLKGGGGGPQPVEVVNQNGGGEQAESDAQSDGGEA